MIPCIYVFALIMTSWVLTRGYGKLVINLETDLWSLNAEQFSQQLAEPNALTSCTCTCNVLGLTLR